MESVKRPSKEQVRAWLAERRHGGPLPECEQIRRQLGWDYAPHLRPHHDTEPLEGMKCLYSSSLNMTTPA